MEEPAITGGDKILNNQRSHCYIIYSHSSFTDADHSLVSLKMLWANVNLYSIILYDNIWLTLKNELESGIGLIGVLS
jgi:hypothetical protein